MKFTTQLARCDTVRNSVCVHVRTPCSAPPAYARAEWAALYAGQEWTEGRGFWT